MDNLDEICAAEPADDPTTFSGTGLVLRAARPAEVLLGLAFLASAILKAVDVNAFIVAIGLYGVVANHALQTASALGTLAVEAGLGTALLVGWRPCVATLGAAATLLVGFSGLILYGWIAHGISDCGCAGPLKMGPGVSLLKNGVLLVLCLTAALGLRSGPAKEGRGLLKIVTSLLCAAGVAGYAYAKIEPPQSPPTAQSGPFSEFVFESDGQKIDLGKGDYLVAMLSTTCEHCMASVEKLNQLVGSANVPPLVGLCEGEPDSLKEFVLVTSPQFPTHLIGIQSFFSLIGKQPPRFVLIRDGHPLQTWDGEVPSAQQIAQARQSPPGSPG